MPEHNGANGTGTPGNRDDPPPLPRLARFDAGNGEEHTAVKHRHRGLSLTASSRCDAAKVGLAAGWKWHYRPMASPGRSLARRKGRERGQKGPVSLPESLARARGAGRLGKICPKLLLAPRARGRGFTPRPDHGHQSLAPREGQGPRSVVANVHNSLARTKGQGAPFCSGKFAGTASPPRARAGGDAVGSILRPLSPDVSKYVRGPRNATAGQGQGRFLEERPRTAAKPAAPSDRFWPPAGKFFRP